MTFDPSGGTGGHRGPPPPPDVAPAWWEDDRGWEDDGWGEFPRRRRSRVLQLTGVVVAAALVLGSAGSLAGVLLSGHSAVVLPTGDATLATSDAGGRHLVITFEIENPTGADVAPVCTVVVVHGGRVVTGPDEEQMQSLPAHAHGVGSIELPVTSGPPPGSQAQVACKT